MMLFQLFSETVGEKAENRLKELMTLCPKALENEAEYEKYIEKYNKDDTFKCKKHDEIKENHKKRTAVAPKHKKKPSKKCEYKPNEIDSWTEKKFFDDYKNIIHVECRGLITEELFDNKKDDLVEKCKISRQSDTIQKLIDSGDFKKCNGMTDIITTSCNNFTVGIKNNTLNELNGISNEVKDFVEKECPYKNIDGYNKIKTDLENFCKDPSKYEKLEDYEDSINDRNRFEKCPSYKEIENTWSPIKEKCDNDIKNLNDLTQSQLNINSNFENCTKGQRQTFNMRKEEVRSTCTELSGEKVSLDKFESKKEIMKLCSEFEKIDKKHKELKDFCERQWKYLENDENVGDKITLCDKKAKKDFKDKECRKIEEKFKKLMKGMEKFNSSPEYKRLLEDYNGKGCSSSLITDSKEYVKNYMNGVLQTRTIDITIDFSEGSSLKVYPQFSCEPEGECKDAVKDQLNKINKDCKNKGEKEIRHKFEDIDLKWNPRINYSIKIMVNDNKLPESFGGSDSESKALDLETNRLCGYKHFEKKDVDIGIVQELPIKITIEQRLDPAKDGKDCPWDEKTQIQDSEINQ